MILNRFNTKPGVLGEYLLPGRRDPKSNVIEGSLEVKLPTIPGRWKSTARKKLRQGESQKREGKRWRRSEREKVRREKVQARTNVGKPRNTLFFPMLWREARLEIKHVQSTPGSDHLWKLRGRRSARCCGTKHMSKWKCRKHLSRSAFGS